MVDVSTVYIGLQLPVPPSMFEDNGDMRITKSKSVLKKKIRVEISDRNPMPDTIIINGCAVMWVIPWPFIGTLEDFVLNVIVYLGEKLILT